MAAKSEDAELLLISGKLFEQDIPEDKRYLLKYFRTKMQEDFLKYYLVMDGHDNFAMHSGHRVSDRWLFMLVVRMNNLEKIRKKAKSEIDLETLTLIETGKYRIFDGGRLWGKKK